MDEIEELKKKLQCQKCHKAYSVQCRGYVYKGCNHHSCWPCLKLETCPICHCSTNYCEIPFLEDMAATFKRYESLQNENSILKEKKVLLETPPDHYKCLACDKLYPDQDMQLCETCHELKFENLQDVKRHALCSTCAIKKHIRKSHKIVDFYPYLSAYNFSSQSPKIHANLAEFKSARDLLTDTCIRFNALSNNVSENYNVLTDMAQRSKHTKHQVEFFDKMEKFIDKSKSIHGEADSDMKNHTTKLEETLAEIKEWYESRMEDCVDESEIIKLKNSDDSDKNDAKVDA